MARPIGWPFTRDPIRMGTVEGIDWAVAYQPTPGHEHFNGYVRIPLEGHPWCTLDSYDHYPVQVHGGLTYGPYPAIDEITFELGGQQHTLPARPAVTLSDTKGWVGFDTVHAFDITPLEEIRKAGCEPAEVSDELRRLLDRSDMVDQYTIFWTLDKVVEETINLARQVAQAKTDAIFTELTLYISGGSNDQDG